MSARLYGRKPKTEDGRDFLLAEHLPATLPKIPADHFGHGNTYSNWRMNGNGPEQEGEGIPSHWTAAKQGAGDCVEAAQVNELKVLLTDAGMKPEEAEALIGSGKTALELYEAITGYNPVTGSGDEGTEIRDRLKYMQKTGLKDAKGRVHKIGVFAAVDPQNVEHLAFAAYHVDAVPLGVSVSRANEEAFAQAEQAGETPVWDHDPESQIEGLHCIPLVGRPDSEHWACPNWALRTLLTEAYREAQVQEGWCYLSPDRISAVTGKSYHGASEDVLAEYVKAVS
jgi:hypothetical protein